MADVLLLGVLIRLNSCTFDDEQLVAEVFPAGPSEKLQDPLTRSGIPKQAVRNCRS